MERDNYLLDFINWCHENHYEGAAHIAGEYLKEHHGNG